VPPERAGGLHIGPDSLFVNVGERTNMAGSRRFAGLIRNGEYEHALDIARSQVENGAQVIDLNMDDVLLDSEQAMSSFLGLVASGARHLPGSRDDRFFPLVRDRGGLENASRQGNCQLGQLEGRRGALPRGRPASCVVTEPAVIAMAFDERGQADTLERRIEVGTRSYRLLTERAGFPPQDVILDPNVFAVATGIEAHNRCAIDFIEATRASQDRPSRCPGERGHQQYLFLPARE